MRRSASRRIDRLQVIQSLSILSARLRTTSDKCRNWQNGFCWNLPSEYSMSTKSSQHCEVSSPNFCLRAACYWYTLLNVIASWQWYRARAETVKSSWLKSLQPSMQNWTIPSHFHSLLPCDSHQLTITNLIVSPKLCYFSYFCRQSSSAFILNKPVCKFIPTRDTYVYISKYASYRSQLRA
jgi:hypothetical protein